jgi:hypothetical protein
VPNLLARRVQLAAAPLILLGVYWLAYGFYVLLIGSEVKGLYSLLYGGAAGAIGMHAWRRRRLTKTAKIFLILFAARCGKGLAATWSLDIWAVPLGCALLLLAVGHFWSPSQAPPRPPRRPKRAADTPDQAETEGRQTTKAKVKKRRRKGWR